MRTQDTFTQMLGDAIKARHFDFIVDLDSPHSFNQQGVSQMLITLQKVKYSAFASEETACFEAVVCIDGTPAFIAKNDGHGGADYHYPLRGQKQEQMRERVDAVEAYAATLPHTEAFGQKFPQSLETITSGLIDQFCLAKKLRGLLSRAAVLFVDGQLSTLTFTRLKPKDYTAKQWEHVRKKYPNARILNEMPFDEAVALAMTSKE